MDRLLAAHEETVADYLVRIRRIEAGERGLGVADAWQERVDAERAVIADLEQRLEGLLRAGG